MELGTRSHASIQEGNGSRMIVTGTKTPPIPNSYQVMRKAKIRVALCVDSLDLPAWMRELISRLVNSDDAVIALLIITNSSSAAQLLPLTTGGSHLLYRLFRKIEMRAFRPSRNAFAPGDCATILEHFPRIEVDPEHLTTGDLGKITDHTPDVILTLSRHPLPDSLISLPAYGVWSYKTTFELRNPSHLNGFWEVLEDVPVTHSALYRLGSGTSADMVICQSASATDKSFVMRNLNGVFWKATHFVERALKNLPERGEKMPAGYPDTDLPMVAQHATVRNPTNQALLFPLLAHLTRMMIRKLKGMLYRSRWVLMLRSPSGSPAFRMVLPPGKGVWADPHIFVKDGRHHVFIEEVPQGSRTGRIATFELNDKGDVPTPRTVLERPYHLSYPFVFEWQRVIYMIPQSTGQPGIELYRCVSFPNSWEFDKYLLPGIDAVDSTLVMKDGRWWLFTCTRDNSGYSPSEELCIFYADSPVSDKWTPHPRNPVISDVRRARPAGAFFEDDNHLYRPSQDCSIRYGYGTRINRVEILNDKEYVEREVAFLEPVWDRRVKGIHSIAVNKSLTVFDALVQQRKFFLRPASG